MSKKYTIGVMIGNANSPHTMDLMQGIFHAAHSMNVNVIFFLGIHSSYYYKSYFGEDVEDDYEGKLYVYKVNTNFDKELAKEYQIAVNPTLLFVKNAEVLDRKTGAHTLAELKTWVEALL